MPNGPHVARWIAAHPNTRLVCTLEGRRRRYWLVDDSTGEWFGYE